MNESIRTLVALDTSVSRDVVQAALPRAVDIELVGVVEGLDESWLTLQETPTDVFVVACAGYSERALFLIDGAVKQRPGRPVVVLSENAPAGFVRRLFEVGADDVVLLPEEPSRVQFAIQKALARQEGAHAGATLGKAPLVVVLGPKGGTGKTLTATNLAVALAERKRKVALVDLDLQFGDVALCLGLPPTSTLYDLVKAGGSIDAEKVNAYMVEHSSGVRALLAPSRPDHASLVTSELLREVYATLRATYDVVVVDTPPGFTAEVIATIDSSSDAVMVGMLDSLSLKNTKLGLETLELMGYPSDRVRLVLNRAGSKVGITADDVREIVGRTPEILVPSDRSIPRAVNEGVPLVLARHDSEAAKAFRSLAEAFVREETSANGKVRDASGLRRLIGVKA